MSQNKIYVNQPFRLKLNSKIDLRSANAYRIQVFKPSGATGTLTTGVTLLSPSRIYYDYTATTNDESGDWRWQGEVQLDIGADWTPFATGFYHIFARGE